jgi:hypothetical protein
MKAIDKMTDHEVWLDWVNNFVTVEAMAEYYSVGAIEIHNKLTLGRNEHDRLAKIEKAKKTLSDVGFHTDNLWHIDDVKSKFKCTGKQAMSILSEALANDATMQQIWYAIGFHAEEEGLCEVEEEPV